MSEQPYELLEYLVKIGGATGFFYFVIWTLARSMQKQYEDRISALEANSIRCEADRERLHTEMRNLQQNQIDVLAQLREQKPA